MLFVLGIITFGLSSILGGLNFIATIVTMRAPGMTWFRMPIFVWSVFAASLLSLLVTQFFAASLLMILLDRAVEWRSSMPRAEAIRSSTSNCSGFTYILPIMVPPAQHLSLIATSQAVVGYRLAGVSESSDSDRGPPHVHQRDERYLHAPFMWPPNISIPTGLVFGRPAPFGAPCANDALCSPCYQFLIGGITGIFLADGPPTSAQDTYFIVAHFHYTIMGAEIFAFFA